MREIQLTKGYVAQVDDEDYERLNQFKWYAQEAKHPDDSIKNVYAIRKVYDNGKRTTQSMHRFILGITDPHIKVDHWDHDGLNNQRYNVRIATHAQNNHNRRLSNKNTSGFKGVSWDKVKHKWHAQVKVDGKNKHLGLFLDKREAALTYDTAALLYHKEFACTNTMLAAAA